MAQAIYADDRLFRAMTFGAPKSDDRDFLRSYIEAGATRLGKNADSFLSRARERFESFDLVGLDRKLNAFARKVRHMFDDDYIRPMSRIGEFQQAGPSMQRWCMANQKMQRLARSGVANGWRDQYKDPYPNRSGEDHPDYQAVVNGLATVDEHGHSSYTQYFNVYDRDYREELTHYQQTTIRDVVWQNLEALLAAGGDDPSDPDNGSL